MARALLCRPAMHRHAPSQIALLAALFALACGGDDHGSDADAGPDPVPTVCDSGPCPTPPSAECRAALYFDGAPEDGLRVGERVDGTLVPYVDGGDATYVFGFQGGVMIQPVIEVPSSLVGDSPCVQVQVTHRPDPAYPDQAGDIASFPQLTLNGELRAEGDAWVLGPLDDQVGWLSPDGVRMILEVTLRGTTWARRTELALRVVDEDGWDACDVVPEEGRFGCSVHPLSGRATVVHVAEPATTACDSLVDVTLRLDPDAEVPEGCVELEQTIQMHRSCVESRGIAVDYAEDAHWELDASGSCGTSIGFGQTHHCDC